MSDHSAIVRKKDLLKFKPTIKTYFMSKEIKFIQPPDKAIFFSDFITFIHISFTSIVREKKFQPSTYDQLQTPKSLHALAIL